MSRVPWELWSERIARATGASAVADRMNWSDGGPYVLVTL